MAGQIQPTSPEQWVLRLRRNSTIGKGMEENTTSMSILFVEQYYQHCCLSSLL
jgi:hypothetical protein